MSRTFENRYVNGLYLFDNPTWHEEHGEIKAAWIDRILTQNLLEPLTIVEIGCGSGEILVHLKQKRPEAKVVGFEISPQAYEICSRKRADGLEFYLADYLKEDTHPADLVMAIDVLEHVSDYMGFLRLLKPTARYHLFHIPLDLSVQSLARGSSFQGIRYQTGHLHYFVKYTALATLEDCGYRIVDFVYTRSSQELPNKSMRTKIANIPRKITQMISEELSARFFGGYSILVLTR